MFRCNLIWVTNMHIAANEALAKLASVGLFPNMILYMIGDYRLRVVKATKIMFLWFAATNFTPVVGAFMADSFLGRFLAIGLGSILSFLVRSFVLSNYPLSWFQKKKKKLPIILYFFSC